MSKANKQSRGGSGLAVLLLLFGAALAGAGGADTSTASPGTIPAHYLAAYQAAADECPALDWQLLAAIGWVETKHGQSPLPGVHSGSNSSGAMGPMQFIGSTWAAYDHGNVYDIDDAAPAAAEYLCRNGLARGDTRAAVYAYNHSWTYVATVLDKADVYRG